MDNDKNQAKVNSFVELFSYCAISGSFLSAENELYQGSFTCSTLSGQKSKFTFMYVKIDIGECRAIVRIDLTYIKHLDHDRPDWKRKVLLLLQNFFNG